jgi:cytochrome P450
MVTHPTIALDDPAFYSGDPYPGYAWLRANDPVHRYEESDHSFWALSRHADVQFVSKHPEQFRSGEGVLLSDLLAGGATNDSIIYLDPPKHQKHRKLVSPSLTIRRVADLEPRVRTITTELLDAIDPTQAVEAVDAVSSLLPLFVIAELLGVPRSDFDQFRRWSDAAIAAGSEPTDEAYALAAELFMYLADAVSARRDDPGDDLISVVLAGRVDGESLTDNEINMFCFTLLVAGNETTRNLISNGLVALAEHPDQRALLAADPSRITLGVEELLRWEPPVNSFCRRATQDVELSGQQIREGDFVVMLYGSANRDDEAFGPTADVFDVTRDPNPHVSFGYAEHFCMGAGLARLEGRVLFEEVLRRWPRYELAGDVERLPSRLVRGIGKLPITFEP